MHSPPIHEQNGMREPDADAIKMFVGQVPRSMDENELTKMFEEYGDVHQLNVLRDKGSGQSKGCCFVTFYTRKAALDAQNALHNIKTMPGMHHPVQMKPADSEKKNEERKLFIGMINKKYDEAEVKMMFAPFGTIEDCTVLRDQNGQSRGCAFITFSTRQSAQNCIKSMHHSQTMEGCSSALVVKFADTPREKEQKKMHQMNANMMSPSFGGGSGGVGGMNMTPQYLALIQQAITSGNLGMLANMGNMGGLNAMNIQQLLALLAAASNNPGGFMQGNNQQRGNQMGGNAGNRSNNMAQNLASLMQNMGNFSSVFGNMGKNTGGNMPNNMGFNSMRNIGGNQLAATGGASGNQNQSASTSNSGFGGLQGFGNNNMGASNMSSGLNNASSGLDALSQAFSGIQQYAASFPNAFGSQGQQMPGANSGAGKQTEGPEGANLFIYHLPQEFSDQDLMQTFMPFGSVLSAKVFVDKMTSVSKCFGFVSYDNALSAQAAIQAMNGFQIGMKRLKVQLKRAKNDSKPY